MPRLFDVQLVQARATAEREFVTQQRMVGDVDDRAGQDEILLHVQVVGPRGMRVPTR